MSNLPNLTDQQPHVTPQEMNNIFTPTLLGAAYFGQYPSITTALDVNGKLSAPNPVYTQPSSPPMEISTNYNSFLYAQNAVSDDDTVPDELNEENMEKLFDVIAKHNLPRQNVIFDGLGLWVRKGENRDSNDSEDGDLTSRSGEIELKDYQLPPYRYICGGCGAFYLKSQSVAAHNRACEKYLEQKAENNGILKNKKEKVSKKWWLNYLINNPDQRDGFRKSKKIRKGTGRGKKLDVKKIVDFEANMDFNQDLLFRKEMYNTLSMNLEHWVVIYHQVLLRTNINIPNNIDGYSETPPELINHVIAQLRLNREDVVMDIGSGIGNVLLQISAQVGCRSFGIEIRDDLSHQANNMKENYINIMKDHRLPFGDIQLLHGNALSDEIEMFLSKVNTIIMNNILFDEETEDSLLEKFSRHLKHGARVITCRGLFTNDHRNNDMRSAVMAIFEQPLVCSVEHGSAFYYIYTVNRLRNLVID